MRGCLVLSLSPSLCPPLCISVHLSFFLRSSTCCAWRHLAPTPPGNQGICFLGKLKFDDFLRHYLGEAPGTVIDRETGEHIGEHRGLWFHTIGQRKGVGPGLKPGFVNLGPWYVSGKDMVGNVLEVTNNRDAIDEPRESFQVWLVGCSFLFCCFWFSYGSVNSHPGRKGTLNRNAW